MFLREFFELEAGRTSYGLLVRSSFQSPRFEWVAPSKKVEIFVRDPTHRLMSEPGPEGRVNPFNPMNVATYRIKGVNCTGG